MFVQPVRRCPVSKHPLALVTHPLTGASARAGYGGDRPSYGSGGGFGADRGASFGTSIAVPPSALPLLTNHVPSRPRLRCPRGAAHALEAPVHSPPGQPVLRRHRRRRQRLLQRLRGHQRAHRRGQAGPQAQGLRLRRVWQRRGAEEGPRPVWHPVPGQKRPCQRCRAPYVVPRPRDCFAANTAAAKDRVEAREITDWTRKGPLPDLPGQRRTSERAGFGSGRDRAFEGGSDAGSERGERRRPPPFAGDGKERDFGNWERKGPLSPSAAPGGPPREGGRPRNFEAGAARPERRQSPAWGEGQGDAGSRGSRREFQPSEKPQYDRQPTAPELDNQWRTKMRPDAPSPTATPDASTPSSPAPQPAAPAGRPRLNLAKRTVSEAQPAQDTTPSDKPNPFGAARPIDTATREKEIEEKRQLALRQKKEADDKAREEKKAKEQAEKAAAKDSTPATPSTEKKQDGSDEKPRANFEILQRAGDDGTSAGQDEDAEGEIVEDKAVKPQEVVRDAPKSEGSWRRKSNTPAAPAGTTTETLDDDGWSTVTKSVKNTKSNNRRGGGGAPARAIAS
ncbi:hypothetical protein NX059_010979 [Plenodomus lindquistii]|nr:hypothetical protein NX059_010979 [Plenodomus lindquistii]